MSNFNVAEAAQAIIEDLKEAARRMNLGEPMATTAAELGLTPRELTELIVQYKVEQEAPRELTETIVHYNIEQDS